MKCVWIALSGIGISETFLVKSLEDLRAISQVTALCTGTKSAYTVQDIEYDGLGWIETQEFSLVQKIHNRFNRHILGKRPKLLETRRIRSEIRLSKLNHREWDFAYLHYGPIVSYVAPFFVKHDIPFFLQVHGYDVSKKFADSRYREDFLKFGNKAQAIICNSNHLKRLCILAGINSDKVKVVRNGLSGDTITPRYSKKTKFPSFVQFGRLTPKKNPIATLLAFNIVAHKHEDARLTFIGSGPEEHRLKEFITRLQLEKKVEVLPAMKREAALTIVEEKWVYCQHSVSALDGDHEGFPNSIAEAALLEMAIVSTRHNGIPEQIIEGKTGLLVNEFDYEAMGEAMLKLVKNADLRLSIGQEARKHILNLCDSENRTKEIENLIRNSLGM